MQSSDYIMAIIIASTAFSGFTILFADLIDKSSKSDDTKRLYKMHLLGIFAAGILAVAFALLWFSANTWEASDYKDRTIICAAAASPIFFLVQLLYLWVIACTLWWPKGNT